MGKNVLIIAGEVSGDLYGGELVEVLKKENSDIQFTGIGGEKMEAAGVSLLERSDRIAVVGFVEVLGKYFVIRSAFQKVVEFIDHKGVERAILIDYPGFNLRLAKALHARGIPVTYFIPPQIWAWHEERIKIIKKYIEQVICIFPFEKEWYGSRGVDVNVVGHPIVDRKFREISREAYLATLGIEPSKKVVTLFPGSRQQEVDRHLPIMIEAVSILQRDVNMIIGKAKGIRIKYHGNLFVEENHPEDALRLADVAVVASGTSTLEAAWHLIPSVVVYRVSPLTAFIAKRMIKTKFVSLPNVILGKEIFRELIQEDLNSNVLAASVREILDSEIRSREIRENLRLVRIKLGEPGVFERAAELILSRMS